jgi:hypothetical protein
VRKPTGPADNPPCALPARGAAGQLALEIELLLEDLLQQLGLVLQRRK